MVDYDYASLTALEAEVVKLGDEFVSHRCKDVEEAIRRFGDANGWIVQHLNPIGEKVFSAVTGQSRWGRLERYLRPCRCAGEESHNPARD